VDIPSASLAELPDEDTVAQTMKVDIVIVRSSNYEAIRFDV